MPRREDIARILVVGSGPIVIGQAAEFDYSGTQALKALRNAGYYLIVVNSNSATIMTDPELSDAVYIEPLTDEFLELVIAREHPDALLPTMGGQTALNLAVSLAESGILERYGVELIGAPLDAIRRAEDRARFKQTMLSIGMEVPKSQQVTSLQEAFAVANELGYPVVARPSFTLGGTGGGIAYNAEEIRRVVGRGLIESPTHSVLLEESVIGWKEYELEVMRDRADNVIIVCSIENLDPMGVHTGDSITVAPAQTLTDREYQTMRDAGIAILRAIGVDTGGSNIQFAVDPDTGRMVVIEMNPRVSRSSALASKATGYPIAKVAALLAVGYRLDEIPNDITQRTTAAFEPALDYVVVKVPRFQMEKFPGADPRLNTQMKSVGEVMAIGRTFKEALGKALRSLELDATPKLDFDHLLPYLANPTPERLAYIYAALRRGFPIDQLNALTRIDRWFLSELAEFIGLEDQLRQTDWEDVGLAQLAAAKPWGFSDRELGEIFGQTEDAIRSRREEVGVVPCFKMVDTCAAEFEAATPYFYSTYGGRVNEAEPSSRKSVVILGSGPNRIGQGIEFDYANVHAVWGLQEEGYEVVMVNSNPETVSTDYDTADRLYFEPLTAEDVLTIIEHEQPEGVVVGFGGQTPLKIARTLVQKGVRVLGSGFDVIEMAENREQFGALLDQIGLKVPPYGTATSVEEALRVAGGLGYPVLVRPSFVLGGRAMELVETPVELRHYIAEASRISAGYPVLIDRFLSHAQELDVDVLSDGHHVWVAGLMEQIEEAGIHSGDSACVLPPVSISMDMVGHIEQTSARLTKALNAVGLTNIQMALQGEELFILEANPRASRTVPFVSKAIGIPIAKLAAKVIVGRRLRELLAPYWPFAVRPGALRDVDVLAELPIAGNLLPTPWPEQFWVKEAIVPFQRFLGADALLGPEMRSIGEVMSVGRNLPEAFAKAQIASGNPLPTEGAALVSLANPDKREGVALVSHLSDLGFSIIATRGTARALEAAGVLAATVAKVGEGRPDVVDLIAQRKVSLVVNTPSVSQRDRPQPGPPLPTSAQERGVPLPIEGRHTVGQRIRVAALDYHVPYVTTLVALRATVGAIRSLRSSALSVSPLKAVSLNSGATPGRVKDASELLEELAAIPSPSGEEDEVAEYLLGQMRALGFRAHRDKVGNVVGALGSPDAAREILLLGHIDTVPGLIPVRRIKNRLYGRGTVDAKGALAAFVLSAARVAPHLGESCRIVVIGAVGEESRSVGAWHLANTREAPYCVLIGEPSHWEGITLGYKGLLCAEYRMVLPGTHSADDSPAPSEVAVAFWNRLMTYAEERNGGRSGHFDTVDPELRTFQSFSDGLNDGVEMDIAIRLPLGLEPAELQREMTQWRDEAELVFTCGDAAYRSEKNTPPVRALLRAIRAEGGRPRFKLKTGSSDMNIVGQVWDCPFVAYGPGDSSLDHTPDEHIQLDDLHRAVSILARALEILAT